MLIDLWKRFAGLLPSSMITINGDGTSSLTTPEGGTLRVIGNSAAAGSNVYVQFGRILVPAPNLPTFDLTVLVANIGRFL